MFNIYDECIGVFYEENMLCVALLTKMKVIAKRRTTGYRCPGQQGLFNAPSASYRNEHTQVIIFIFTQLVLFLCQLLFVLSRSHQLQTSGTMDAYNRNDERIDHYLHCFMISFPIGLCSSIVCDLVQDRIKSNVKSLERFILLLISVWLSAHLHLGGTGGNGGTG